MSDARFLPTTFEQHLAHLVEEAGEVSAAAGKTLRFGPNSVNPLQAPEARERNIDWLRREMADLRGAMDRLDAYMAKVRL